MSLVYIAPFDETFTPTSSGAIATVIWEHCRQAQTQGVAPHVIAAQSEAAPFAWPNAILLPLPPQPTQGGAFIKARLHRKLSGWTHMNHHLWAQNVERELKQRALTGLPIVVINDPDLAVYLKSRLPQSFIAHYFQAQLESKPRVREAYKTAVSLTLGVSDFTSRWAEEYYSLPKNSTQTIYNGVDLEQFFPASDAPETPVVINYVGRLGREKALDTLLLAALQAVDSCPPFAIQIAGSNSGSNYILDDYQKEIHELANQLKARGIAVEFAGHLSRAQVPQQLRKAHINVVPSRWEEAFGIATLEGMACGLATIASRTGGTPEVVGEAGFLFERDDVQMLAKHLVAFLNDAALRTEYSRLGLERAQSLTWQHAWLNLRQSLEQSGCALKISDQNATNQNATDQNHS